jgi:hypothetical protein
MTNGTDVTGTIGPLPSCIDPVLDFGDAATNNDNDTIGLSDGGEDPFRHGGGMFRLGGGDNLTLQPGTYYFTPLELTGGSTLTLTGPTTIYTTGRLVVGGGGVINPSGDPHDLSIIASGDRVSWTGGSDTYGSLLAPNAQIVIGGGGDFFGAAIGLELEMTGGSHFHVDESLPFNGGTEAVPPVLIR